MFGEQPRRVASATRQRVIVSPRHVTGIVANLAHTAFPFEMRSDSIRSGLWQPNKNTRINFKAG
jgi:hypothetical protein